MGDPCRKCELLLELYRRTPQTPRDYWVMTELFVMLHGGDVCSEGSGERSEMKVAINKDFGGFGLSVEAYKELGLPWDGYGYAYNEHDKRTNPKLIKIIERLGDKASGPLSCVGIVEIPNGVQWTIEEYDGVEQVAEIHRTWN